MTTKGGYGIIHVCMYIPSAQCINLVHLPFFFVCLSVPQDVAKTLASFDFEMLDRLAVKCTKVHEENLERLRQQYYDDVTSKGPNSQTETTTK